MAELSTLARPYAKAAFEYAVAAGDLAGWSAQLALAAGVAASDKMVKVLSSPALTSAQQATTFVEVCGDELSDKVKNFVKVLAENKRLGLLPHISALFEEFKANREKSVDVEVASVFELGDDIKQALAGKLATVLDREVNISTTIDKDLIGGVVIRAADVVIDGSVRGRLAKLAEAMHG